MENPNDLHHRWMTFWRGRYQVRNRRDNSDQTRRVQSLLLSKLTPADYYEDGMDFGCGEGRFVSTLTNHVGHLWGVDILPELGEQLAGVSPFFSYQLASFLELPKCPKLDFLWASFVFQHLVDQEAFELAARGLRDLLKPGARVLILDNAVDKAYHVRSRKPEEFVAALGLRPGWKAELVTVNQRAEDHWLLDSTRQ